MNENGEHGVRYNTLPSDASLLNRLIKRTLQIARLKELAKSLELDEAARGHLDLRSSPAPSLLRVVGASIRDVEKRVSFCVIDIRFARGKEIVMIVMSDPDVLIHSAALKRYGVGRFTKAILVRTKKVEK